MKIESTKTGPIKSQFQKNIKYIRTSLRLSVSEMATKLGVTETNLNRWEMGYSEPTLKGFVLLPCKINFSLDDLAITNMELAFTPEELLYKYIKPVK